MIYFNSAKENKANKAYTKSCKNTLRAGAKLDDRAILHVEREHNFSVSE